MSIAGLHHVTATVDGAQPDLEFCVRVLGLCLVKRTINFDNHFVHHFYYAADAVGSPGRIWTTFPYGGRGVRIGTKGAGQVTVTSLSVPEGSLASWRARFAKASTPCHDVAHRFGEETLEFADPSGLRVELVATARDPRDAWSGGLPGDRAIRGLHSVTIQVRDPQPTIDLMTALLGFEVVSERNGRIRVAVAGDVPGHAIDVVHDPDAPTAVNGLGTVHHVAMSITSDAEQVELRERLIAAGRTVTEIRDRCYFKSIYFREPGHVLFEVATQAPGFTADEDAASLGRTLKLPPWEEPSRAEIEAALAPIAI